MTAIIFLVCLVVIGTWNITDAWFSVATHWKRDGQTFWKDQLVRIVRLAFGLVLVYMAIFFGAQTLIR